MLIIENLSTNNASKKSEILAHTQTISNFFTDAIDQNDCNVKVVIGFYQELDETINSIIDLDKAFKPKPMEWYRPPTEDVVKPEDILVGKEDEELKNEVITKAAIKALKDSCFTCRFSLPRFNFDNDLGFLYEKLKLQLSVFNSSLDIARRSDFCHAAYAFQNTCIPDIVKMIGMLLTAYAAIMALNKLPSFSLQVFIRGVISSLLIKVVGTIKISLDVSSTGLPCLLSVLEELASKVPTNEALYEGLSEEDRSNSWIAEYVPQTIVEANLKEQLKNKEISPEEYAFNLEEYARKNDPVRYYTKELENKLQAEKEDTEEIFAYINGIAEKAQGDIGTYIDSILGVINFFECEGKRSGSDFTEIMEYIGDLTNVINMLSSIAGLFMKKVLQLDLCKDAKTVKKVQEVLEDTSVGVLTPEDMKDLVEEFNGLESQLADDDLSILLYDKPKKSTLPKLTLMGCNFKEFAEAHKLENIIKATIDDFVEENRAEDLKTSKNFDKNFGASSSEDKWKNIVNIVFPDRSNTEVVDKDVYEDKYSKYLKPLLLNPNFNTEIKGPGTNPLSNILPGHISRKDTETIRDLTITYLNGSYKDYNEVTDNFLQSNIKFNYKYSKIEDKMQNIQSFKGKVVAKVDLSYGSLEETLNGFTGSLDELVDFIYNNPFKDDSKDDSDKSFIFGPKNPDSKEDLNLSGVFQNNNEDSIKQQNTYSPDNGECRSIEDVLSVLNNLNI